MKKRKPPPIGYMSWLLWITRPQNKEVWAEPVREELLDLYATLGMCRLAMKSFKQEQPMKGADHETPAPHPNP
jgi:hypothetical protein